MHVNTVPYEMQIETIELQSFNMLKAKYVSVPIAHFHKEYNQKSSYLYLYNDAKRVMYILGTWKHILLRAPFSENELRKE